MKKTVLFLTLLLTVLSACSPFGAQVPPQVTVVVSKITPPPPCQLAPGESVSVSAMGVMPENAQIIWSSTNGGIFTNPNSVTTVYTAPVQPSSNHVEIIANISISGKMAVTPMLTCDIIGAAAAQSSPTALTTAAPVEKPTDPATAVAGQAVTHTPTAAPAQPQPAQAAVKPGAGMIAITEIMGNPCGKGKEQQANEYIELYNYSDRPVDLAGVFVMASNQEEYGYDLPNPLVAWKTRNAVPEAFAGLVTDSTILPPKGFALILEPNYHLLDSDHKMPYQIPAGTLILTLEKKNRLGSEIGGLITSGIGNVVRDSVYVYAGTAKHVDQLLSTYAVRNAGPYPYSITRPDQLPLETPECQSVQRVTVPGEDKRANWTYGEATPGWGSY